MAADPTLLDRVTNVSDFIWGGTWNGEQVLLFPPMVVILLGVGLWIMIGLRFYPITHLGEAFAGLFKRNRDKDKGEISPFAALSTALSGQVGTGNLAGVATAITLGGPGALFWMWVTAVVGMSRVSMMSLTCWRQPGGRASLALTFVIFLSPCVHHRTDLFRQVIINALRHFAAAHDFRLGLNVAGTGRRQLTGHPVLHLTFHDELSGCNVGARQQQRHYRHYSNAHNHQRRRNPPPGQQDSQNTAQAHAILPESEIRTGFPSRTERHRRGSGPTYPLSVF